MPSDTAAPKIKAERPFVHGIASKPPARWDPEPPYGAPEVKTEQVSARQAMAPAAIRKRFGMPSRPELPEALRQAAAASGRPAAARRLGAAEAARQEAELARARLPQQPPPSSVHYEEHQLRMAFKTMDNDGNGILDVKEIKHLFAQLGQLPNNNMIDGMIYLCDSRGEGTVSVDDFVYLFTHPIEALNVVNKFELQRVVNGGRRGSSDEDDGDEDDGSSGSSSGSSLASRPPPQLAAPAGQPAQEGPPQLEGPADQPALEGPAAAGGGLPGRPELEGEG